MRYNYFIPFVQCTQSESQKGHLYLLLHGSHESSAHYLDTQPAIFIRDVPWEKNQLTCKWQLNYDKHNILCQKEPLKLAGEWWFPGCVGPDQHNLPGKDNQCT